MQSMQRQFGRFMKRSADDSQVSVLLKDFDDADKLLAKIIDSTKAWRDAWSSLLMYQARMASEFESLYAPILGSSDPSAGHKAVPTPEATLVRSNRLKEEYEDLRKELLQELNAVEERMIRPAVQAKDYLSPIKKTIKKRDDRKLDFERYQSRVDNYSKKTKRSDRDNAALSKAESDLARATEEYNGADEHLRQNLPPLITAVFSILPHILAAQVEIQNTMLAHYYTILHNYCEQEQFPSPPPPMDQVIREWEQDCLPVQHELESFACLANGKTVGGGSGAAAAAVDDKDTRTRSRSHGRPILGTRRSSTSLPAAAAARGRSVPPPAPIYETKPRLSDLPAAPPPLASSSSSLAVPISSAQVSPSSLDSYASPEPTASLAFSPAAPRPDYFSRDRQPSAVYLSSPNTLANAGISSATATIIASKKKPPPPPPPPRTPSAQNILFVTALYDFAGQGAGDLVFREGDRIRVLEKTDTTDDWWVGELRGVKGSFPANYVK
ncbi:hypothetical protein ASPZODRAFT_1543737 [Penicilliopsis zonata CBS 506.65]|uniref:SH3 domain-containing protein n=1 Tax=Penicilliopsis zonata CBS 506.65 TaxID=1073090 RepID=A0A1L9SMA2_9EURO|nr:hypothetical protein ASPZODRAFT_1543737 [Penicilliopsis zonata CBS 506.65]OJJ48243.1 hypothetical protein ASPZODRAFT_1543737 [Penicilliopsis zonata CBS 506.65]